MGDKNILNDIIHKYDQYAYLDYEELADIIREICKTFNIEPLKNI